jgi:hypothetical protein
MKVRRGKPSPSGRPQGKKTVAQKLAKLEEKFEAFQNLQREKLKELGKTIGTLWSNEVELDKSANRLDEQFAVLARMLFVRFNELMLQLDADNTIDEKSIEKAFREWAAFRARPDFRNLMMEWFLGVPLSELPPAPKQEERPAVTPDQVAEGPQEFGGDYGEGEDGRLRNETTEQSQSEDEATGEEDAVPEVQDTDEALQQRKRAAVS